MALDALLGSIIYYHKLLGLLVKDMKETSGMARRVDMEQCIMQMEEYNMESGSLTSSFVD